LTDRANDALEENWEFSKTPSTIIVVFFWACAQHGEGVLAAHGGVSLNHAAGLQHVD